MYLHVTSTIRSLRLGLLDFFLRLSYMLSRLENMEVFSSFSRNLNLRQRSGHKGPPKDMSHMT